MADLPETLRKNSATAELARLAAKTKARVPAEATTPAIATLPDGRVIDRAGKTIFTPTPREDKKP